MRWTFKAAAILMSVLPAFHQEMLVRAAEIYSELPGSRPGVMDRIRVFVYQYNEASGEFTIDAQGKCHIPIVGEVDAAGLRNTDIASNIYNKLKDKLKLVEAPSTIVETIHFRAISILGDVQKPGEFNFSPGMAVVNAIGLASGILRPDSGTLRLERDSITAHGNLRVNNRKLHAALARRARLTAEAQQKGQIEFTDALDTRKTEDNSLMNDESRIFNTRKAEIVKELMSLEQVRSLLEREIETRQRQVEAEKQNLALMDKESQSVRDLIARSLAPLSRQLTADRAVVDAKRTQLTIEAELLRAQQSIAEIDQKKISILGTRQLEVVNDLREINTIIDEINQKIETDKRLIDEAEIVTPLSLRAENSAREDSLSFSILRREGDHFERLDAVATDLVSPGDIINVRIRRPSANDKTSLE